MLKAHYPKTKFSVRKEHYNCINVNWTDFPMQEDVEKLLAPFDINDNDSMTDYAGSKSTPFSDKFGGVQYLFCKQELSEEVQKQAIDEMAKEFPLWFNGFEEQPLTFENYKNGIARGGNGFYSHFNNAVRFVLTGEKEQDIESSDTEEFAELKKIEINLLSVKYPFYEVDVSFPIINKNDSLDLNDEMILKECNNETVIISKEIILDNNSFEYISNNLMTSTELWKDEQGEIIEDCIFVSNENHSDSFVVYTSGYNYARYVGRLIVAKNDNYAKIVLSNREQYGLKNACVFYGVDVPNFDSIACITSDILTKMMTV